MDADKRYVIYHGIWSMKTVVVHSMGDSCKTKEFINTEYSQRCCKEFIKELEDQGYTKTKETFMFTF